MKRYFILVISVLLLASCGDKQPQGTTTEKPKKTVVIPSFNADSAYQFVAKQTSFGPRVPETQAHADCAEWLAAKLNEYADTVIVQDFRARLFNGKGIDGQNIVGVFHPEAKKRIVLCAHWDSRPYADHDPDEANIHTPIDGANDGASGVGVILELARCMAQMPPSVGVDFILFDVEDQGTPDWAETRDNDTWCKGSQYWAQHPHQPCYSALYGILFDMVGTQNPRFTKEDISAQYAPTTLDKVWEVAHALGYGNVFVNQKTDPILDDHYYVNQLAGIPTIDIVQNSEGHNFFAHWHTQADNIDCIDSTTLRIVGTVTLKTLYADYPNQ